MALDWNEAQLIELNVRDLDERPIEGAAYANYPEAASNPRSYDNWQKQLNQFIRTNLTLKLFLSPTLKLVSEVGEEERDFRIRLQHLAHEQRDDALEAIRKKYGSKIGTLETRQRRAQQAVEKQSSMASQRKMDAAVSAGSAILGALFGRKNISATSISRVGTAVKSTSRALKSDQGINAAQETLQSIEAQLEDVQLELEQELEKISERYDMLKEKLDVVEVRATSSNITVQLVGLAWVPR
jgi:vacuolar-type H+-ATPase subunit I/STV1